MKVLFVMCEGIGNMIMALPAIEAIRDAGYELSVCGKCPALDLLPPNVNGVNLDEIETCDSFDVILLSAWSAQYIEKYPDGIPSDFFLSEPIHTGEHEALIHFDLAAVLDGVEIPDDMSRVRIPEIPTHPTRLPDKDYVVFCNTAAPLWDKKRWGGYPELAHLISNKCDILYLGAEGDSRYFHAEQYPENTTAVFDRPLLESAQLLKHASWVVGNDCGLIHIASALKTPTVAIFGPTSTIKNAPLDTFAESPKTVIVRPNLACAPCQYADWEAVCEVRECLEGISAKEVHRVIINGLNDISLRDISIVPKPMRKAEQKLAVVMRVKDAMDTIAECLEEAIRVTDRLIIVDNGSTDGTLEYLMDFKAKHPDQFCEFRFDDVQGITGVIPRDTFTIAQTVGYDQPRDREVMDRLLKASDATWGMFLDADEIVSKQITKTLVKCWMHSTEYNAILFRHVHFWQDKEHYRIDQRWKPRHRRMMWRITPESTIQDPAKIHPEIVHNLKGRCLKTDYVIKHYGHIDKEKNRKRAEFYRIMDNPSMPDYSGNTYEHMTNEAIVELTEWVETADIKAREFGNPSQLLVLLHANGDMLMATPAIAKLKKDTPDLEISVMGLGKTKERDFRTRDFFENNPDVHAYYDSSIDHHPTWWDDATWQKEDNPVIWEDINQIQQLTQFDVISIVALQSDFQKHRIDRFAEVCRTPLTAEEKRMRIYPTQKESQRACEILSEYPHFFDCNGDCLKQIVSVHRWCGNTPKSWDYTEYKNLCDFLLQEGFKLILWDMGDPESPIQNENIINMRNVSNGLSIGVSAVIMEMCDLHIGADSLPMHLASAVNIPTIGIFERTVFSQGAPLNANAIIASSLYSLYHGDDDFYTQNQHRIVPCEKTHVAAKHLYPIIEKCYLKIGE